MGAPGQPWCFYPSTVEGAVKSEKVFAVKSETNSSVGCPPEHDCWCQNKCCNKSPFAGDDRCVCGPHSYDWLTPQQCGAAPPPPVPNSCSAVSVKTDCGYNGINAAQCQARNCCWEPSAPGQPWCFYPSTAEEVVKSEQTFVVK